MAKKLDKEKFDKLKEYDKDSDEYKELESEIIDDLRDLIRYYAHRYSASSSKYDFEDFVQEGYIQAIKKIRNVDTDMSIGEIGSYISTRIRGRFYVMANRHEKSSNNGGVGIKEEAIIENQTDEDNNLNDNIVKTTEINIENESIKAVLYRGIKEQLSDTEYKYIVRYYGFFGHEMKNQPEIADELDVTRSAVSYGMRSAEKTLKEWLLDHEIDARTVTGMLTKN